MATRGKFLWCRRYNSYTQRGRKDAQKLAKKWIVQGKSTESDRHIGVKMPKHLYSGKMSNGKKDYR